MASLKRLKKIRERREKRVRSKISGTQMRPRLSVFRSSRYIYVQAIADDVGKTLAQASTLDNDIKGNLAGLKNVEAAREVGKLMAKNLLSKGIKEAVFDRGRFLYHGRTKSLAEGVRETGIKL
ncbi:MAG: 50S ribosomal protein L18 [Thermodesulfobacteriota bacterium]|nr:50S ribosomal protein L18 [Thermodesulfobacteriota bacterium]